MQGRVFVCSGKFVTYGVGRLFDSNGIPFFLSFFFFKENRISILIRSFWVFIQSFIFLVQCHNFPFEVYTFCGLQLLKR